MRARDQTGCATIAAKTSFTSAKLARPKRVYQADFLSPPERSNAIHSVDLCCSQIVKMAIVIGNPIKAPAMTQKKLQKNTTSKTMNGDIDNAAPAMRGSR